jgi:hypothetical protein
MPVNLLDLVPAFERQLQQFKNAEHTDSTLAAYLADAVEALNYRWVRNYTITYTAPNTYHVNPDIVAKDKRPIILQASIIYKMGNASFISFRDGDFAWNPAQGRTNPLALDLAELEKVLPYTPKLAQAITAPIRGYSNIFNPESYMVIIGMAL